MTNDSRTSTGNVERLWARLQKHLLENTESVFALSAGTSPYTLSKAKQPQPFFQGPGFLLGLPDLYGRQTPRFLWILRGTHSSLPTESWLLESTILIHGHWVWQGPLCILVCRKWTSLCIAKIPLTVISPDLPPPSTRTWTHWRKSLWRKSWIPPSGGSESGKCNPNAHYIACLMVFNILLHPEQWQK